MKTTEKFFNSDSAYTAVAKKASAIDTTASITISIRQDTLKHSKPITVWFNDDGSITADVGDRLVEKVSGKKGFSTKSKSIDSIAVKKAQQLKSSIEDTIVHTVSKKQTVDTKVKDKQSKSGVLGSMLIAAGVVATIFLIIKLLPLCQKKNNG